MNTNKSSGLLSTTRLGDLDVRNRIALAPMTRAQSGEDRVPNALMAEYYAQRASAGLLITEATSVSAQGNGWVCSPGMYTDEQAAGWKTVVDAVHAKGAPIFLQLWHTGRASHSDFHGGELPVAPSAIRLEGAGVHTPLGKKEHEVPRALETGELPGIVRDYVRATRYAKDAGFDGVELHSANGYLLDQFLQSRTNQRTDAYGGSVEKRFRLLREVLEGIVGEIGADKVGVRLAPNGVFNDMGSADYRETFSYAAKELDGFGLGFLHVMDGLAFGFHELGEPMTLAEFREHFRGPLIGNCGYTAESAEAAIAAGHADMIAFGRPFITNPDLVERFANGWPLAEPSDPATWYSGGEPSAENYTLYPAYQA